MNSVYALRLPGQLIQEIEAHEQKNFSRPSNLWDRIVKVLPRDGEIALLYVMASSLDANVAIIYTQNGVEQCRQLPISEKGSLGQLLFLHCMTTLPVWSALRGQYDFEYIYFYGQKLSNDIIVGDQSTYPRYVERITPQDTVDAGDYEFNMFRFQMVGESRDPQNTVAIRAAIRCVARSTTRELSTNINEIFPVLQYGPLITFNSYVPFPCQILTPYDNECTLGAAKEYGLHAQDAVIAISDERIVIHALQGVQVMDVPPMTVMGQ
ncbi:hypothetical protein pEaSNUABM10_00083 [Erwinia phage pEa_SNUABM_10]|nr:hypothetical protein pEaSNUABM10_00083 [Erwinia phage pEa_SNUABM_10]